jgi:hypothetical protein
MAKEASVYAAPKTKLKTAYTKIGEEEFDNAYSDGAQYGRVNFWDAYYVEETEPFEWYFDYYVFQETINEVVARDGKVLLAGTGNSHMPEDVSLLSSLSWC